MKELKDLMKEDVSGVSARLVKEGDLRFLVGSITGPKDTPYEGGTWQVSVEIPRNYPFEPPKMKFITPMWHPNISSQTGAICIDILSTSQEKSAWSPALTIKTALLSLQLLMQCPEPNDPQDAQVASQYKADRKAWEATAREWTRAHAAPGAKGGDAPRPAAATASGSAVGGSAGASAAAAPSLPAGCEPREAPNVRKLMELGFDGAQSLAALRSKNGSFDRAMESLLK